MRAAAIPDIPAPITRTEGAGLCWLSMSEVIVPNHYTQKSEGKRS
jgi:hypothetical protein